MCIVSLSLFIFIILTLISLLAATKGISAVSREGQILSLYNEYQALVVGVSGFRIYLWWQRNRRGTDSLAFQKRAIWRFTYSCG